MLSAAQFRICPVWGPQIFVVIHSTFLIFGGRFSCLRRCCYLRHSSPGAEKFRVVIGGTIRIFVGGLGYCYSAHNFQSVEFGQGENRVVIRSTFLGKFRFFALQGLLSTAHFQKIMLLWLLFTAQFPCFSKKFRLRAVGCYAAHSLRGGQNFSCASCYRRHNSDFCIFSVEVVICDTF